MSTKRPSAGREPVHRGIDREKAKGDSSAVTRWRGSKISENASSHRSVLQHQVLEALSTVARGGWVVDATLGAGGHSEALLRARPDLRIVGIDRDAAALAMAAQRLACFGDRFVSFHGAFSELRRALASIGDKPVVGLIADLGVSSMQLDQAERGFAFRRSGPLDMRMDRTSDTPLGTLLRRWSEEELADILFAYGEERQSRRIAKSIKAALQTDQLEDTAALRNAIHRAVAKARQGRTDSATRSFQALRIAVNDEIGELKALLRNSEACLTQGAVAVIISFHSLEDRLIKRHFRSRDCWQELHKKPRLPSDEECQQNPRARSAKLRAARYHRPLESPGQTLYAPPRADGGAA